MNPIDLGIAALTEGYRAQRWSISEVLEEIQARLVARGEDAVWIHRLSRTALQEHVERVEERRRRGETLPLLGVPFAIKDNIDLAGHPTTAACPDFAYLPSRSATAVQRLLDAGAIPLGKTNLDQFATGLVGTRSPYGAPRSVFNADYISGGSSSGSAVAVAANLASFALGTDTAGSGRVPAAFNNLVGLKPTRGLVSVAGVVPACHSLDCPSIFARNVEDSLLVLEIMEGLDPLDAGSRPAEHRNFSGTPQQFRFGVPQPAQLRFFGDDEAAALYVKAIQRLQQMGGTRVEIDYQPFVETAQLLYQGPWVVERLVAVETFYRTRAESMDPTVRQIIAGAESITAADVFRGLYRLDELRARVQPVWESIDVLLLPTTGTTYTVAQIQADPIQLNSNLGYYTNFVNLLDLCGTAVPAGFRPNGLPFGVTFLSTAFRDRAVSQLAAQFLATL